MTPVKLTSADIDSSEVVVMFDKITHVEKTKTAFGDEQTKIHMGKDSLVVKESVNEVFYKLAYALHGVDQPPPDEDAPYDEAEDSRLPDMTRQELISYLMKLEAEESDD